MSSLKLNIKRFGISIDEDKPVYSYSENAEMKINADLKVEGTNRKLKDIDTDLSNVITLDLTRIAVPVKLWQNSKPHEAFGKQTISVPNLNQYDYIEIFFKNWVQGHYGFMSTKCPVANGNVFALCYTICLYNGTSASTPHIGERLGTLSTSNNTISFENNFGAVLNSTLAATSNNAWGVPQFILGYKFPSQGGNS